MSNKLSGHKYVDNKSARLDKSNQSMSVATLQYMTARDTVYFAQTSSNVASKIKDEREANRAIALYVLLESGYTITSEYETRFKTIVYDLPGGTDIITLPRGEVVKKIPFEQESELNFITWIKVYYHGSNIGWVDILDLKLVNSGGEGPGKEVQEYFAITHQHNLTVRESASSEADELIKIQRGDIFNIVLPKTVENSFVKIYYDGDKIGWVSEEYIHPNVPVVTNFDETNYSLQNGITGTVDGKNQGLSMVWGLCGGGDYGQAEVPKDSQGRYAVAVGPRILYKDYPDMGGCRTDDFNGFSRHIEVELEHKDTGATKIIKCLVSDVKAHTYGKYPDNHSKKDDTIQNAEFPVENGILQTGIRYPNATNKDVVAENHDGSVIEFKGGKFSDFKLMDYKIVKVTTNLQRTDLFIDMPR